MNVSGFGRHITSVVRGLMVFDSLTFLLAMALHLGVHVPIGFTFLAEPPIQDAAIVEGIAGFAFAVCVYAGFVHKPWLWSITFAAHVFAFVGVLVGIGAIAAGLGPRTDLNMIYHRVMLTVLVIGLILLLTPAGRVGLRHSSH